MKASNASEATMDKELLKAIREHATKDTRRVLLPPATRYAIDAAERQLGFKIPKLLASVYVEIANGGLGPGYGIIGVKGGHASNLGTLVDAFNEMKRGADYLGRIWPAGMLPFCEWGCNIFSCIDCTSQTGSIWLSDELELSAQNYDLDAFFRRWVAGVDLLTRGTPAKQSVEITNPFTRTKTKVSRRRSGD